MAAVGKKSFGRRKFFFLRPSITRDPKKKKMSGNSFGPDIENQIAQVAAQFGDYTGLIGPPAPLQRAQSQAFTPGDDILRFKGQLQAETKTILEKYQSQMEQELQKAQKSRETLTEAAQKILDAAKKNNLGVISKEKQENGAQQERPPREETSQSETQG